MTTTPHDIIHYLLPFVATAGSYSACVQQRVGTHDAKDGATVFHHALSDADLTVQSYLEVALLARFPDVSFFSEEQAQSLNAKYFPTNAHLEVLLDPIDGTRAYIDNSPHYQIIVTIHDRSEIVGALCYMPRRDRCYIATKGEGAYILTHREARSGGRGTRVRLGAASGPLLLFNQPEMLAKLTPHFETRDIVSEYARSGTLFDYTDFFEGRSIAIVSSPCQAIDGGAIAFIAQEAGATATDLQGDPLGNFRESPKRVLPGSLTSASPDVHEAILKILSE